MSLCLICAEGLNGSPTLDPSRSLSKYDCVNCGKFWLSGSLEAVLENRPYDDKQLARISFAIRKAQNKENEIIVSAEMAVKWADEVQLPRALEQISLLILHLGNSLSEPGATVPLEPAHLRAVTGATSATAASWPIHETFNLGWLSGIECRSANHPFSLLNATLTVAGWEAFERFQTSQSASRRAFMAMKFGDAELDEVFHKTFKPATKQTGFDLLRLDETPRAGLIDDRLRVEIRRSAFLIADLSHANHGAYWEAGFAEGLGKPVIYTCKREVFEDSLKKPHFDTNHHLTARCQLS